MPHRPLLTLTTDFGVSSPYVAEMKGVILSALPEVQIVDVTHAVPPQDIRQGAVVLDRVCDAFPAETCHVAVVDPGVGTSRKILLARANQQSFVAPDNGLLSRVLRRLRPDCVVSLDLPELWRADASTTFQGRDVMAPAACLALGGAPAHQLGSPVDEWICLDWPQPIVEANEVVAEVVSIDAFGNLATNVRTEHLSGAPSPRAITVTIRHQAISQWVSSYAECAAGSLVILWSSAGELELAEVNGNAAQRLTAQVGDRLRIVW